MLAYWEPGLEWMGDGLLAAICPSFTGPTGLAALDVSGRSNPGTLTNMDRNTAWVTSGGKGALSFDGTDDFVKPENVRGIGTGNFSVFSWIRHSVSARRYMVASNLTDVGSEGHWLAVQSNQIYSYFGSELAVTATGFTLADDQWHCIGVTRVGTTGTAFVDGRQIGSPQAIGGFDAGKGVFRIGARGDSLTQNWQGQLDDLRIYSRALTAPEIRQLYELGRGGGMLHQPPKKRSYFAQVTTFNRRLLSNRQLCYPA